MAIAHVASDLSEAIDQIALIDPIGRAVIVPSDRQWPQKAAKRAVSV
jgi:hypothetical protein